MKRMTTMTMVKTETMMTTTTIVNAIWLNLESIMVTIMADDYEEPGASILWGTEAKLFLVGEREDKFWVHETSAQFLSRFDQYLILHITCCCIGISVYLPACLSEELIFDANCCRLNAFHERYMYVYTWDSRFLNIQCCAHLMRVQVPTPAGAAGNDILCMKCVSLGLL